MLNIILLSAALIWIHMNYPSECCGGKDCRAVPCEQIHAQGDYFIWQGRSFHKSVVRPSEDGGCHVCLNALSVFCIFLGGTS